MIVCQKCLVELECTQNETLVEWPGGSTRYGDTHRCPKCFFSVVTGFGTPVETSEIGLKMKEENYERKST